MEEFLNGFLNSDMPLVVAFVMGLLVSLSPCTLAANVAALSYVSNNSMSSRQKSILAGAAYVCGKSVAYVVLGFFLCLFVDGLKLGAIVHTYFGYILGPFFLLMGLLLLEIIHIHGLADRCTTVVNMLGGRYAYGGPFLLGVILAFAFCPYCGAIYFGGLIPLAVSVPYSMAVLMVFSIGAALPLLLISVGFSFAFAGAKSYYGRIAKLGVWLRRILAVLFIITGFLFIYEFYIE